MPYGYDDDAEEREDPSFRIHATVTTTAGDESDAADLVRGALLDGESAGKIQEYEVEDGDGAAVDIFVELTARTKKEAKRVVVALFKQTEGVTGVEISEIEGDD